MTSDGPAGPPKAMTRTASNGAVTSGNYNERFLHDDIDAPGRHAQSLRHRDDTTRLARRVPWLDDGGDGRGEQPGRLEPCVSTAPSRDMGRLDTHRSHLPVLHLHRRGVDNVLATKPRVEQYREARGAHPGIRPVPERIPAIR